MILTARDVSVSFDGFRAVDNASLDVPESSIIGLVGPNGAGKSSFFGAITGFVAAEKGRITLGEDDIGDLPPYLRVRKGLARTFQVPREFTHLSVRDNLAASPPAQSGETLRGLFLRPQAVRRDEALARERGDAVLEQIGLSHVATLQAGSLSGGQRKLLELGRAVLTEPRVILLDEPFGGVNPVMIETVSALIVKLNRTGIAFLIVEHNLAALSRLVSMLYVMDRGNVIASGTPAEVLASPNVQEAYLGRTVT